MATSAARQAMIYRMVMPDHICPYGLKSVDLLKHEGFVVDDHWLTTRPEIVIDIKDEDYGGRGFSCRDPERHL